MTDKKTKSGIIVPDNSDIIVPGKEKKKKEEVISTMIQIPFVFNTGQTMEEVITNLDEVIKKERVATINAIGKLLGISVNWEE